MFRDDDYHHNYRDSFIEGAFVGGLFSLCLLFVWRCRWVIGLLALGFWLSYHTSGEASRNNLIAAKFDENLVTMSSFRIDRTVKDYSENNVFRSFNVTVKNDSPATLIDFTVYCSYYLLPVTAGDLNTRHVVFSGRVKGDRVLEPNTSRDYVVATDIGDEGDLRRADRSSMSCKVSYKKFDTHEQLRSIAKK